MLWVYSPALKLGMCPSLGEQQELKGQAHQMAQKHTTWLLEDARQHLVKAYAYFFWYRMSFPMLASSFPRHLGNQKAYQRECGHNYSQTTAAPKRKTVLPLGSGLGGPGPLIENTPAISQ